MSFQTISSILRQGKYVVTGAELRLGMMASYIVVMSTGKDVLAHIFCSVINILCTLRVHLVICGDI
jgi:hypothetical protein